MSSKTKDDEMISGLTLDERDRLLRGLHELPDTMPPRVVWQRIREQGEAEGLLKAPATPRTSVWITGFAIAASVVVAVLLLPKLLWQETPQPTATEPQLAATDSQPMGVTALQALMVQSQRLESDLRALPEEPKVMRASTVATIADIEDAIAAIDFQLNESGVEMTPEERELFWRERVRLMKSLLQLRYAQAQRTAF